MDGTETTPGSWVSVSALAQLKGRTKQTISERVARLQEQGLIEVRRRGREKTVNLAEWDEVTGETTDPARLVAQETGKAVRGAALDDHVDSNLSGGKQPSDPTYVRELTRKAGYEADRREIEVRKLRGELLEIDDVRDAMTRCAEAIVRDIDQLPAFADDLAAALSRNGVAGLREALKTKARELRATLAQAMTLTSETEDDEEHAI